MPGIGMITSLQAAEGTPTAQPILPSSSPHDQSAPTQPLPPDSPLGTLHPVTNRLDITV